MAIDVLSRKDEDVEASPCTLSIIQPYSIVEEREEWKNDLSVRMLIQKLRKEHNVSNTFIWKNDSLW